MCYYNLRLKASRFNFEEGYTISEKISKEYRKMLKLFNSCYKNIKDHKINIGKQKLEENYLKIIEFYFLAEKLLYSLLTELFSFTSEMQKMESIFIILNDTSKMFYMFDDVRSNNCSLFCDAKSVKNLDTREKIVSFMSVAIPMGHLFVSTFTYQNREIYIHTNLIKRNKIQLCHRKREKLRFISFYLCVSKFEYLYLYVSGVYKNFFSDEWWSIPIKFSDRKKREYFEILTKM